MRSGIPGKPRSTRGHRLVWMACVVLLAACSSLSRQPKNDALNEARHLWRDTAAVQRKDLAARNWLHCAVVAYQASEQGSAAQQAEAQTLADNCTHELLGYLLDVKPDPWRSQSLRVLDVPLRVEFRDLPDSLDDGPVALARADEVTIPPVMGERFATPGYGVPMVGWQKRCNDKPICMLYPPEGITRSLTAWVEPGADGVAQLIVSGMREHPDITIGKRSVPLATDPSATLAALYDRSHINRLALWNLIGGRQFALREGLYLLEDYDPNKTPVIMVHGLGRSPMVWAKLTNLIDGDPDLRARYQIWHVVYPTNTPQLLNRLIVQRSLDQAWHILDPDGTAPAHQDVTLIGHSMGGVISRLIVSDSNDVIWKAAFDIPPEQLRGTPADLAIVDSVFRFHAYPGVTRTIFLAAPHLGSPYVDSLIGQVALRVVHAHAPELDALVRVAAENRAHENPLLAKDYEQYGLSSISTLRDAQPVSHAAQSLMPVKGVRYYTFAGKLPGTDPPGDGFVPLKSATIPGAVSTTVVKDGHQLYLNDEVLAKILDILRQPSAP
jgi:pimeloyl-ACP methyl ester carboxylesterase